MSAFLLRNTERKVHFDLFKKILAKFEKMTPPKREDQKHFLLDIIDNICENKFKNSLPQPKLAYKSEEPPAKLDHRAISLHTAGVGCHHNYSFKA